MPRLTDHRTGIRGLTSFNHPHVMYSTALYCTYSTSTQHPASPPPNQDQPHNPLLQMAPPLHDILTTRDGHLHEFSQQNRPQGQKLYRKYVGLMLLLQLRKIVWRTTFIWIISLPRKLKLINHRYIKVTVDLM